MGYPGKVSESHEWEILKFPLEKTWYHLQVFSVWYLELKGMLL